MNTAQRRQWDIFCRVIDNFGDIGVSWRLARQLVSEHGLTVRLWVDQLASLQALCPPVDAGAEGVGHPQHAAALSERGPGLPLGHGVRG